MRSKSRFCLHLFFFFFNDTATTEIYTLSLHDALPIRIPRSPGELPISWRVRGALPPCVRCSDRKSTRLNSSHQIISYAVFCLKKKKKTKRTPARKRKTKQQGK